MAIEGLKFVMDSVELIRHCRERAEYHARRAEEKEAKIPSLRESLETIKGSRGTSIGNSPKSSYHLDPDDPIDALERDIENHRSRSLLFKFFADHFIAGDYYLKEDDLQRLEIVRRN